MTLLRAANGHWVAACRTDTPARMQPETIDHTEGLGISISTDDGRTWSAVRKLYDWGRHHPSLILLPGGEIVMTYVVRKGYVNTPDGFPQFGIEAVVVGTMAKPGTWTTNTYCTTGLGISKEAELRGIRSQATSTVRLPDGFLLTAFGTGYRCQDIVKGLPAPPTLACPWRLNAGPPALTRSSAMHRSIPSSAMSSVPLAADMAKEHPMRDEDKSPACTFRNSGRRVRTRSLQEWQVPVGRVAQIINSAVSQNCILRSPGKPNALPFLQHPADHKSAMPHSAGLPQPTGVLD